MLMLIIGYLVSTYICASHPVANVLYIPMYVCVGITDCDLWLVVLRAPGIQQAHVYG